MAIGNRIRYLLQAIAGWLNDHTLAMCNNCGRICFYKNITLVAHRISGRTQLCDHCYREIYLPYSEDDHA